ncbi:SRPBCC family protein [Cellulomonas edaphi]|uniref:Polyketide cyclase n=1 Tax=Cellulomonas edaphi TaxID=3053468 RepID=A0ABT7S7H0_9CELL|nr:SRPBCC family protein [Cellulomons edaphi]MDM7831575.1 hypothetical protein [Cellulomons edaphi]
MRQRRYRLSSTWLLAAPVGTCWDVLADPTMSWPRWWPGVRARDVVATTGLVGSRAHVEFASRARYRLRLELEVAQADAPHRVVLATTGDLVGTADVVLGEEPGRLTRVVVDWDVSTTVPWMNLAGPVLARPFAASHAAVMRDGERGLTAYLGAHTR